LKNDDPKNDSFLIKIRNITKSFGDLQVLKGIDLEIPSGKLYSIVGPSGAGKTTLLQIIGTLSKPDSGELIFNKQKISELKQKKLAAFRNQEIGFIFQFHYLLPEFTALENVCIPAFIAGTSKKEAEAKASDLLVYLGLADRLGHKPSELSGGERQRVAAARALINDPSVILADEPSGNLDTKNKEELHDLFFDLRDRFHQTFVIVTHDENFARQSDMIIRLKDGVIEGKN
jgi:lipoprotein-releasing system ATP-binding protein